MLKLLIATIALSLLGIQVSAQTLPVGIPVLEEYYRRAQLSGKLDSNVSFTIRPISPSNAFNFEANADRESKTRIISLLPVVLKQQYNSTLPAGWNDGEMLPSRGYQSSMSAGVYVKKGMLSIQLRPQVLYAQNKEYEGFPPEYPDFMWSRYYDYYYNIIDAPARYGNGSYSKVSLEQSSVRLSYKQFSLGISNENLWWGPGKRNALLMSNTAAGFNHITLNTIQPVQTKIGTFEAQVIAGKLDDSGFEPPQASRMYVDNTLFKPRNTEWRLLSGLVLAYQPKWVKGLFLGYATTSQAYHSDAGIVNYIPFFLPFKRFSGENTERKSDQYSSIFARWVFKESQVELYFEYGKNNHSYTYENLPENPSKSYAYIAGMSKLIAIGSADDQIGINLEFTELASPGLKKAGEPWYVNNYVRQGYTHKGQLLGAGIGPGSGTQSADLSWNRGLKKISLGFERYIHNNQLFYYFFQGTRDVRRHWVDLNTSLAAQWDYRNLLFSANIQNNKSLNYQYIFDSANEGVPFAPGKDVANFSGNLSVAFRF